MFMAGERKKNKEEKDEHETSDGQDTGKERADDEMSEYVQDLNRFMLLISELEWPEQLDLKNDTELSVRMFRDWRRESRRSREMRHRNDKDGFVHVGRVNEEAVRRFLRGKFHHFMDIDDEPMHIDPEDHQPDEEHTEEEAKDRKQRFQNEWE
jgi:hypothetical protein